MQDVFITKIHIGKVRHLENIDIILSNDERKHLILTGKNGSGKTSLLEAMRNDVFIKQRENFLQNQNTFDDISRKIWFNNLFTGVKEIKKPNIEIIYSMPIDKIIDIIFVYITTKRNEIILPDVIETIDIHGKEIISRNASKDFLKYILHLYVQYLSAKDSGGEANIINNYFEWFENLTFALRTIYDSHELVLKPDMKNLSFQIIIPGREPFGLHEMADGYAAFLDVYMELLMRMESSNAIVKYDNPAIVFIDEIETHLHVELQKRVLPFLTTSFPNIQFIVATHSPFVITSLDNAIVYDLEKHIRLDGNLTDYSYTDIVEGYYDISECSVDLQSDFDRYVNLCKMDSRSDIEREETRKLFERLSKIPGTSPLSTAFYMFERGRKNGEDN